MARDLADVALMLDAGAGHHPDDPFSFDASGSFVTALESSDKPTRVAFSPDLGIVPMAREVREVADKAIRHLTGAGVDVTDDIPDFSDALDGFQTLRAILLGTLMGELLESERKRITEDIVRNVERGFEVTSERLFAAERVRWTLYHRMTTFFETHDLLICPSASIPAFPVDLRYVTEIDQHSIRIYEG
jgi:amidase